MVADQGKCGLDELFGVLPVVMEVQRRTVIDQVEQPDAGGRADEECEPGGEGTMTRIGQAARGTCR